MASFDRVQLRRAFGRYATGVTVVTYYSEDTPRGATVNSFTSVSLDPPLALVSIARDARAAGHLGQGPFAINILGADQVAIALNFAGVPKELPYPPFSDDYGSQPAPVIAKCMTSIQCRPWATYDGGDHLLFVGEVIDLLDPADDVEASPLGFVGGRFCKVEPDGRSWAAKDELFDAMQIDLSISW